MNATAGPAAAGDVRPATPCADSIVPLATGVADVISAWAKLVQLELALAQHNLGWLLVGAIVVPVAALGVFISLTALLVAGAHMYTNSWLLALLLSAGVQLLALAILLNQLRCWARDLTLPESRATLIHAVERIA
jgi:hypothetical protein